MPAGRFSIEAIFKAKDRFTAPVAKMASKTRAFSRSVSRSFRGVQKQADKLGASLKKAGVIAGTATVAGGAAAKAILGTGVNFEQAMADVGAVSLQSVDQIRDLEAKAIELGSTTKFTATEAAEAMETMARAGFKQSEIMVGVQGVLDAAAASGLEMGEVADVVSKSLKGMGLEADQATRVADVLATASAKTNSTIGSLGESMKNVGATAAQFGVSFEDTVASVALLQDVGLDASVAGSAMNTMLTKLAKPTDAVRKQLKKLKVEFEDTEGNMLPFPELVNNLGKAMDGAGGNMAQVALIADMVGLRGQKAAIQLAKLGKVGEDGTSKFSRLQAELAKAEGNAKKMADLKLNSVKGQFTLLMSAIDGVRIAIFKGSGGFKDNIEKMREWVDTNKDLIATNVGDFFRKVIENLPKIWKWTQRVVKVAAALIGYVAVIKILTIVTTVYTGVVKALGVAWTVLKGIGTALRLVWVALVFITRKSTISMVANKAATIASTVAMKAQRAAAIALKIATGAGTALIWLQTTAVKVGAIAMGGYGAATGAAAGASVALKAAIVPLLPVLAAATAAIGALMVAHDQASKLSKETGGLGITGVIGGMIDKGTFNPFEVVDEHMNEQARKEARERQATAGSVVTSGDRVSREVLESTTTNKIEIDVSTSGGAKASVKGDAGPNSTLNVVPSGAF